MTCREMEGLFRDLIRPQTMETQGVPSDAAEHLPACPRCTMQFERERHLTASLTALAGSIQSSAPAAVEEIETRLRAAFREEWQDRSDLPRGVSPQAARRSSLWAAGIAAILIVSLGIVSLGIMLRGPRLPGAPVESEVELGPEESTVDAGPSAAKPPAPNKVNRSARRGVGSIARETPMGSPAAMVSRATESVNLGQPQQFGSGFVPLFYGGDPQLLEAGQVWRVEMPRAALQSVGVPVVEESRAGRIQVDILLGEDGIARAIRFVQ